MERRPRKHRYQKEEKNSKWRMCGTRGIIDKLSVFIILARREVEAFAGGHGEGGHQGCHIVPWPCLSDVRHLYCAKDPTLGQFTLENEEKYPYSPHLIWHPVEEERAN